MQGLSKCIDGLSDKMHNFSFAHPKVRKFTNLISFRVSCDEQIVTAVKKQQKIHDSLNTLFVVICALWRLYKL